MEPSAIFLSCPDCTRLQAEEGCPEGYHLCTKIELLMGKCDETRTDWKSAALLPLLGGYQVIKQMGLLSTTTSPYVFTGEETSEAMQLEGEKVGFSYLS